ncbi:DUF3276 family protein [Ancylomarina euxinus]|uniref:DUF3276 family protein n=1 Tax=Ancylomarina euxinus TaxID=2283627 RepID=A0A425Y208_9BACT|nr:DUF3276 family protein [Ancylomarina euxinus]MCZ4695157.1 DUF3276 family protein [Ancylomarina euxinus]MUP14909.1 DUF3276 family protein [Ancylomarina euxinus]RRG21803.1 DUF3276 family protein [Ancylomarina euxinus]
MEGYGKKEEFVKKNREDIYSNAVRAGKRTYFFDAKATRNEDYYLTITESKKRYDKEGNYTFEKHKIFLYKEDFEKFSEGLMEAIEILKEANDTLGENTIETMDEIENSSDIIQGLGVESFSQVEFEDLTE